MTQKHFRSPAAHRIINQAMYRGLFERSPNAYLVLSPNLEIINGNDAFVAMTRIERDVFAGKYMFDAFPDNPADPENTGVKNLLDSFNRVLQTKRADMLKFQRYDVQNQEGIWENRRWDGTSWAVTDKKSINGVILHVNEYKTNEISQLLGEAQAQILASRKLANEAERLIAEIKRGRLDSIETLRELLTAGSRTIH